MQKKTRKSRLDKYYDDIVAMNRMGLSANHIAIWVSDREYELDENAKDVYPTTISVFMRRNGIVSKIVEGSPNGNRFDAIPCENCNDCEFKKNMLSYDGGYYVSYCEKAMRMIHKQKLRIPNWCPHLELIPFDEKYSID